MNALLLATAFMAQGLTKQANMQEEFATRSMGNNPIFGPTRSQRVKNKIRARQKNS